MLYASSLMQHSVTKGARRTGRPYPLAGWVIDTIGATVFAAALSSLVALQAGQGTLLSTTIAILLLLSSGLLRATGQYIASVGALLQGQRLTRAIREDAWPTLLGSRHWRGRSEGEDASLAVDAMGRLDDYYGRFASLRRAAFVSPLLFAVASAMGSLVAAAILLLTLIPFAIGMVLAGKAARSEADAQLASLTRLGGLFVDRAQALPAILMFGAEERIVRQIGTSAQDVAQRTLAVLRIAFVSNAVLEFFAALSVALVAVYCGFSLLGLLPVTPPETLTLAEAFFVLALVPDFYLGMRRLAAAYHDKQQGEAALALLDNEITEARSQVSPPVADAPCDSVGLQVGDLVLRYADGTSVGPVTFAWQGPGLYAISGETGSGKSSLLKAFVGLVPVAAGEVQFTGIVTLIGPDGNIAWADQHSLLRPGTLRSNLACGIGQGDDAAAEAVLARIGLAPMLNRRGGLDLDLDQRGSGLSGGERRRIGLARAFLSNRPVLLLDEPTADLDADQAAAVRTLLVELATTRLVIVATHDRALIDAARATVRLP